MNEIGENHLFCIVNASRGYDSTPRLMQFSETPFDWTYVLGIIMPRSVQSMTFDVERGELDRADGRIFNLKNRILRY